MTFGMQGRHCGSTCDVKSCFCATCCKWCRGSMDLNVLLCVVRRRISSNIALQERYPPDYILTSPFSLLTSGHFPADFSLPNLKRCSGSANVSKMCSRELDALFDATASNSADVVTIENHLVMEEPLYTDGVDANWTLMVQLHDNLDRAMLAWESCTLSFNQSCGLHLREVVLADSAMWQRALSFSQLQQRTSRWLRWQSEVLSQLLEGHVRLSSQHTVPTWSSHGLDS